MNLRINVNKLKMNPDNPRTFKEIDLENIVKSLLCFPEMLEARPPVIADNVVLGGNLRLKGLKAILTKPLDEIAAIIAEHSKDKSTERIEFLINHWSNYHKEKVVTAMDANTFTPEQRKEFAIKDNISIGSWDYDVLANSWNAEDLNNWGLHTWGSETVEEVEEEIAEEKSNEYTKTIKAPTYEPKNEKPLITDLFKEEKTISFMQEIKNSNIELAEKEFLIKAAQRHLVFDYSKIADYYAHASIDMQVLMEKSALVIIDFDKAIENGYVQLTDEISNEYTNEYGDSDV